MEARARAELDKAGFRTDYFTVCNALTLETAQHDDSDLVILAAAWLGKTRLIDNLRFTR